MTGYIIYRSMINSNGSEVARTSSLSWTDTSARAGRRYYYNVRAYDAAGNLGNRTTRVSVVAK